MINKDEKPRQVIEDSSEENEPKTEVFGVVVDCAMLNLREQPELQSKVKDVLSADDTVTIVDQSNENFYEVETKSGKKGYCMKKYIRIV